MSTESSSTDRRELMKRALARIEELEQRLKATERRPKEPIAIVGMACRFPGGVSSPDDYWRFLCQGGDGVRPFPPDRLGKEDGTETLYGGFVEDIDQFDAAFFGITPREARSMDPQQRLLLETTWHALEDAGQPPDELQGSRTGVFVGITTNDYGELIDDLAPELTDVYVATGNALNAAAGRISFVLGLQGPCVALDTACSSSLVAVHLACRSLTVGECELALAGGVNLVLRADASKLFAQWGMMARDGRCKTFDAAADGFVRSEGCGIIALRRLSDARARGDRILAVVAGSAVNSDGRSSGLTVPNGLAQQALIRQALEDAGTTAADVHYVEAHGTGTSLGDPIEIEALARALAMGRPTDRPLLVGSVKTNIGHTEAASGIAGLMKTALAISHGRIPAHLHFKDPSPAISWNIAPIRVVTGLTEWPSEPGRKRLAGVSSFGFSGTNAHVILAGAPDAVDEDRAIAPGRSTHVLTLSVRHPEVLRSLGAAYAERLATMPTEAFANMCYSANVGRARLPERLAVVAESPEQVRRALSTWSERGTAPSVFRGTAKLSGTPRIAFLFTGQGSQYVGMGKGLFEGSRVFRQTIERCAGLLQPHLDRPLVEVLFGGDSVAINDTVYAQPALFALEYALAELWRSWGIVPDLVLGHSIGELVAATVAGVMSLEDALRLVAARGRLMQELPRNGAMATVFADATVVRSALNGHENTLAIAAVNGPQNTVISGTTDALERVLTTLGEQGVGHMRLTVSHAFHSPLMDPMLNRFEHEARTIDYRAPSCVVISNVTAKPIGADGFSASYWRRHARSAVQFLGSIHALSVNNIDIALELGPAPTLTGLVNRAVGGNGLCAIEGLKRGKDNWASICEAAAKLHVGGARIDWECFHSETPRLRMALPTTPFHRQKYWIQASDARKSPQPALGVEAGGHPLLGKPIVLATRPGISVWETEISLDRFPYLEDHRVQERSVFPATAYAEMVLAAAADRFGWQPMALYELDFKSVLVLTPGVSLRVQVTLEGHSDDLRFVVHSRPIDSPPDRFTEHMSGRASRLSSDAIAETSEQAYLESQSHCQETMDGTAFYRQMSERGNDWGPSFQGTQKLWIGSNEACAMVAPPPNVEEQVERYVFHPALADACGHVLAATAIGPQNAKGRDGFVGRGIDEIRVYRPARGRLFRAWAVRDAARESPRTVVGDVRVVDERGQLVAETLGATLQFLDGTRSSVVDVDDWHYDVEWSPLGVAGSVESTAPLGCVIAISEDPAVGKAFAERLQSEGVDVEYVEASDHGSPRLITPNEADEIVWRLRANASAPGNVIYVTTAGERSFDDVEGVEQTVLARCGSLLHLAQALTRDAGTPAGRLWIISRQAVRVGSEVPTLTQAPLWALGRSLSIECGTAWGGLIDFDPAAHADTLAAEVAAVLVSSDFEDQLAFRDGWYVPRLVRRHLPTATESARLDPNGSYLVTGGLGGLGLVVADWLARRGARHLVLVGRRALPERHHWDEIEPSDPRARAVAVVRELEGRGVSVRVEPADIGSPIDVARVLQAASSDGVRLRGVVHAAGVPQYEPLADQTIESFQQAFAGKLRGAWLLDRMCGTDVSEFVLFSSASAILNSPFAGAYAAANAFLDALAISRTNHDRRVLSVGWGMWADVGMVARFDAGDRRPGELGRAISPNQGIASLERALASNAAHVAVLPINWQEWRRQYGRLGNAPFLSRLVDLDVSQGDTRNSRRSVRANASRQGGHHTTIEQRLCAEFQRVMDVAPDALDLDVPLISMGLDSLMAVELRAAIENSLGVTLPLLRFLEGATVRDIVHEVASHASEQDRATPQTASVLVEEGEI